MKNIQRMTTILAMAFVGLVSLMLPSGIAAQTVSPSSTFMTEMEKASDLYDNRGYQKDKAINADGKIMVSKTNGNLQYRYDLSSYSAQGFPVTFSLNYNQNASYTSFRAYNGTSNTWEQMKQNRPAWILGVNGFAVQALTSTKRPLLAPEMRTNMGSYTSAAFVDEDVIWMLDGYDYCNRMNDISRLPSGQSAYVDVIRLLREDGSVMELYHVENQTCDVGSPTIAARVTGTYISASANSSAYAIVTTDVGLLSPAVRAELIMRYASEANIPADRLPRRVEYYPGDGLTYVFREWTTPYGIEPYQDNIEVVDAVSGHAGGETAGPTIFYLVSILHNNTNLVDFDYDSHIIGGTSYVATNQLRQRGHARLKGFDSHTLTWGLNDLTIDAIGKRTVIEFNDAIYGGKVESWVKNLKCAPPLVNEGLWIDPSQYVSWTGLVTRIIDPVGRTTTFGYDETTREIQKSEYPFKKINGNYGACPNVDVSCAVLTLKSKRMREVKELDVKYGLTWAHEPATTTQVLASPIPAPGTEMDIVNGTLSQIVQDLKKYDVETNTHLTTESYVVNVHEPTDPAKRSFKSGVTYTDVVGARTRIERMTTEVISLGRASAGWPKVSHSDVTTHEMEAEGIIERTITGYIEVPAWVSGPHSNIRLPGSVEKTTIVGATTLPRTRQEFTYTVGTTPILPYIGGCSVSTGDVHNDVVKMFGHALEKKTELLKVWKSGAWTQDLKTVTEFQHVARRVDTVLIRYWDKHASYAAFLNYVSTRNPAWTQERATEEWNMTNDDSPWIVLWPTPLTTIFTTPPLFNLTKAVELQDPNNGNAILKRVETDYDVTSHRTVGTGERPNLSYGKQTVQRVYGAGLTNAITTTVAYAPSDSWTIGDGALPESVTDGIGAITKFNYQPLDNSWPSALGVSNTGIVSAKILYNDHVGAGTPTNISLRSLGTAMYEKPSVTERRVRKYLTGGGSLQTKSLASFQTYTHYGLPQDVIDENGFLSRFRYDGIGRLQYAWLPGDFPTVPPTTYDWHAYDVLDNVRTYEANGYAAMAGSPSREVTCIGDCAAGVDNAMSYQYWPQMTIGRRLAEQRPPCPCSQSTPMMGRMDHGDDGKGGDEMQYIRQPLPSTTETKVYYYQAVNAAYDADFVFNRWDHLTVSSASIKASIAKVTGSCVAFTVTVTATGVTTVGRNYILNCYPVPDITTVPTNQFAGLVSSNADVDIDLASIINSIKYNSALSTADPFKIHVKIEVDEGSLGTVEFSRVWMDLGGSFRTWGQSAERDFTLAFKHTDAGTTRSVVSLAKIDDRATTAYPTLAYGSLTMESRHAKALSVLTYDDLVKEQRWNYGPLVQNILPLTTTTHGSVSTSSYFGDGLVKKTVDPQSHEVTNTYDDLGRPEQALTSAVNYKWTTPIYNVSSVQTGSETLKTTTTYTIANPSTLGFPTSIEQAFNGYCRYVVTKTGQLAGQTPKTTAQFFDARDRVVLSVDQYTNVADVASLLAGGTTVPDRNHITQYTYDIQGRTKQIVSPGGQAIRYWYDKHGRIRYTFQTDQGYTSYAYDKLGRVRFSQTAAQALVNKVAYYQYDDLGRMTAIGEAALATAPPSPMMGQDHGGVTGDRISKGGPTIQALPAMDEAMNLNRWTDRLGPDSLQTGVGVSPVVTANQTLLMTPVRVPYALWAANNVARNLTCDEMLRTVLSPRFSPMLNPGNQMQVLHHPAYMAAYPTITAPATTFEHAGTYPEFVLQTTWYDEMPPTVGVAWAARPSDAAWQAITPMPGST
ncbi:MAG: hypothetical protein J0I17_13510, partial ['Candidatus Kapabacteria' thiocyanatum]|nr:hypothetical protein ['Candidatus Kapabacteria' thiocyanatum]